MSGSDLNIYQNKVALKIKGLQSTLENSKCNKLFEKQWLKTVCMLFKEIIQLSESIFLSEPELKETALLYITQIYTFISILINDEATTTCINYMVKKYVYKQLHICLEGLNETVLDKVHIKRSGNFIMWMDLASVQLANINAEENIEIILKKFRTAQTTIEEVLCHGMTIAQVAFNEDCRVIKGSCQTVLDQLQSLEKEINKDEPNISMCNLFIDMCHNKLLSLERKINVAVLRLCLKVFAKLEEPFLNIEHYLSRNESLDDSTLNDLIINYDLHVDRIMQIGLFAIDCSTDVNRISKMRSNLASLESLEEELIPVFISVSKHPSEENVDFAAVLKQFWIAQTNSLRNILYFIIEPSAFCDVLIEEVQYIVEQLKNDADKKKAHLLDTIEVFVQMLINIVDVYLTDTDDLSASNKDEIKHSVANVIKIIQEICAAKSQLSYRENNNSERLIKRCCILKTMLKRLCVALKVEDNGPSTEEKQSFNSPREHSDVQPNPFLNLIINRGKMLLEERSILYKTPKLKKILIMRELEKSNRIYPCSAQRSFIRNIPSECELSSFLTSQLNSLHVENK